MRLGIFGGSFDPVHNAHLALARACQQTVALDEIWFTPTAIQPLKQSGPQATAAQRLEQALALDSLLLPDIEMLLQIYRESGDKAKETALMSRVRQAMSTAPR